MKKTIVFSACALLLGFASPASAHQPIIDPGDRAQTQNTELDLDQALSVPDPTVSSEAVYGALNAPSQVMLYEFKTASDGVVPVEVLVPERDANANFRPYIAVISKSIISNQPAPFAYPAGYSAYVIAPPPGERSIFYEPYSMENLYHGTEVQILVKAGEQYFVAVYDPNHLTGDYALSLGTAENFKNTSLVSLAKNLLLIKLGLVGGRQPPWFDLAGYFLFVAGLTVGLGAAIIAGRQGFLGRKSAYWTRAFISTQKMAGPLLWAGLFLATIGSIIIYRRTGLAGTGLLHLILGAVLVVDGSVFSFYVGRFLLRQEKAGQVETPLPLKWRVKIGIVFAVFYLCWLAAAFLLIWHLLFIK